MRKKIIHLFLVMLVTLAVLGPMTGSARADLTITPIRVVFEGRDRSATIELINLTDRTNTYRLKWLEMKMGKSGRFELGPADEDSPYSFTKMVLFTPRQVTIEPRGHQTIRLSLRRPADLPPGEYRAHLSMIRLARQGPEKPDPNAKDLSMEMKVNLGFSVPVIVRSGDDRDLKISLISPKLGLTPDKVAPKPLLNIDVHRETGKFSTYGTVHVYWTPKKGSEKEIGVAGNVALYPELDTRTINVPLKENPTDGSLRIVYRGKYESEGKTWAEKSFPIGN